MTIPHLHDGVPYFSYDCYTWCHPSHLDFGDYLNLDHLVFQRNHHLVPQYVRGMCSLLRALGISPTYLPGVTESDISVLRQTNSREDFAKYYEDHLRSLLHPPKGSTFRDHDEDTAIYRDLLPLRAHLLEVIYATNWRGEGENNVPCYFAHWQNVRCAQETKPIVERDLPALKQSIAPLVEKIDRAVFCGLFSDLEWRSVTLHELKTKWGYPEPREEM